MFNRLRPQLLNVRLFVRFTPQFFYNWFDIKILDFIQIPHHIVYFTI